jgi:hypothetical protein
MLHFRRCLTTRLIVYALLGCLLDGSIAHAQVQKASCTFKLINTTSSDPYHPYCGGVAINDWGTVVGQAWYSGVPTPPPPPPYSAACARYSNGNTQYYAPPGAVSSMMLGRNNKAVSVGQSSDGAPTYAEHSYILQGSTFTFINHPKAIPSGTFAYGINKFNSVVGWYIDKTTGRYLGFKRHSDGTYVDLVYPYRGVQTYPRAINDNGMVVGYYFGGPTGGTHGFLFHKWQWATLDYPNGVGTNLLGISNSGVIVGIDVKPFIYANGTFKYIAVPDALSTTVSGISPGGVLIGGADFGDHSSGFTAVCQ